MAHLLVVEDEAEMAQLLAQYMEVHGHSCTVLHDGQAALDHLHGQPAPDLLLLDWMLPGKDGAQVLQAVRAHPPTAKLPVVVLTARTTSENELEMLRAGADDFLRKPAELEVLLARVERLLPAHQPDQVDFGCVSLDKAARMVRVQGKAVDVTTTEYELLYLLFEQPERIFTRSELLDKLEEEHGRTIFERTIDVHVKNLRHKLGEGAALIRTYRGMGYGLNRDWLA